MMNWKGSGRKRLWTNFKVLSQALPVGMENHKKTSARLASFLAEI
jgi:hypothetical protein